MDAYGQDYFTNIHGPAASERQAIFVSYAKLLGLGTGRVLDIGCGEGGMLGQLSKLGWQGWGVDISNYAIGQAKKNVNATLQTLDVVTSKLPFDDNMFDVVLALDIVEHLTRDDLVFDEIARVLKPGGRVLITTPNKFSWYWRTFRTHLPHDPTHINEHDLDYWVHKLTSRGLTITKKVGVVAFGLPPGRVMRQRWQQRGWPVWVGPVYWPVIEWSGTLVIGASKTV